MPRRIDWKLVRPLVEQVMEGKLSDADGAARLGVTLRSFRGYMPVVAAMKRGDIKTGAEAVAPPTSPPATSSAPSSAASHSSPSTPSPTAGSPEPSPTPAPAPAAPPVVKLPNPSKTQNTPSKVKRDILDELLG